MKVFFIFDEREARERNIGVLLSAFARIECIGQTDDVLGAIEAIQNRFPEAAVSDEPMLEQESGLLSTLFNNNKKELIILPKNPRIKERSIYIGLDFSVVEPEGLGWVISSILRIIEECNEKLTD